MNIFETLLKDLNKANNTRKLKLAEKYGYKTVAEYKAYLETQLGQNLQATPTPKLVKVLPAPTEKPVVHNVHILDASGSMDSEDKIGFAIKGINSEIQELKKDDTVTYTQTIIHFSGSSDIKTEYMLTPIQDVVSFDTHARGMTALYDAIGKTLSNILGSKLVTEKVLVKIFTDGEENNSKKYSAKQIRELIKQCESKGFTITFVGTQQDVRTAQQNLAIDISNTLVHDNTAKGVGQSFAMSRSATKAYTDNLKAGKDVTKGFYKGIKK